ncbi:hypothetical protein B1R94_22155 [Mycolicibacterium litorale]|nr:hypothetical protein B1R94_22155 [Mycolicibacterium litorale]
MTVNGRRRFNEPWREVLLDELTDESEDERRDFTDPERDPFESENGPAMGTDGDDNPEYATPRAKLDGQKLERGDISDPVQVAPKTNPAGEITDAGHGFIVDDPRSRPWKTAPRTHCAHCGGELPPPDVSAYRCEFDPDLTEAELALVGADQGPPVLSPGCRHLAACNCMRPGCQCSGCRLRWLVLSGNERNVGQPRKYCSEGCRNLAGSERKRWQRALAKAVKNGDEPPPEPEDRGLKFRPRRGPLSSTEGTGHRYISASR